MKGRIYSCNATAVIASAAIKANWNLNIVSAGDLFGTNFITKFVTIILLFMEQLLGNGTGTARIIKCD